MAIEYEPAKGRTIEEMRDNVADTDLYKRGDAQLVWVNKADLFLMHVEDQDVRDVLRECVDAMEAVKAEADRAEANGGKGWSSAPVVRLLDARDKAHRVFVEKGLDLSPVAT